MEWDMLKIYLYKIFYQKALGIKSGDLSCAQKKRKLNFNNTSKSVNNQNHHTSQRKQKSTPQFGSQKRSTPKFGSQSNRTPQFGSQKKSAQFGSQNTKRKT
eukprot:UN00815